MSNSFDVIVIGVGGMGSSACYHVARRGMRVLGIEQFGIAHDQGSSHGQSRMIRTAYYEHPDYVPLLQRAWSLWRALEEESGQEVLHQTGGIYLGPSDGELVANSLASSREHGLAHELLSFDQVKARYPQFQIPEDWVGLFEHQAGFLRPERAIRAHARQAAERGATIHCNEAVRNWQSSASGVTVTTDASTYTADRLIICAGAWSSRLISDLGVPLKVTRQVLGWIQPRRREPFELGTLPVWATDNRDGTIFYGFPFLPGEQSMKLAHHGPGPVTDPMTIDRHPRTEDEQSFRPALHRFGSDAQGPVTSMQICMYTNSPDHHFILDRSAVHPRVTLACGFSGHGFKFASVIGEALADLAMEGKSDLPIGFLRLSRFERGKA